jgi:hypothetical protein
MDVNLEKFKARLEVTEAQLEETEVTTKAGQERMRA